jgi:DNA processing protein
MTGEASDGRELRACLALLAVPRLPDWRVLELLQAHGTALAAFDALRAECGAELAAAARGDAVRRRVERAVHAIETDRIALVPFRSAAYPALLVRRLGPAAPPVLFARGNLGLLGQAGVAVVGCRAASAYGLDVAEQLGGAVARAGGCIISGLARGIDTAAHAAALDAGGSTIAVLGCGVDVYYPHENMQLQDRIARGGLLLSEFLPGEAPRRYRFPHRNRIIAGLSSAVVVVEAGATSGALGTATHAMERDVPTFAVPHPIDRAGAAGILGLFRDGVPPFTGVRDLLEYVGLVGIGADVAVPAAATAGSSAGGSSTAAGGSSTAAGGSSTAAVPGLDAAAAPLHARVWAALRRQPRHADEIAEAAAAPSAAVLAALLELELDGRACQAPGGRFSLPSHRRRA